MELGNNRHLAYCTNIHRGRTWDETLESLDRYSMKVRDRVGPGQPYAIGLRLSASAAQDLSDPARLQAFKEWLQERDCYVFTINGFPHGDFHGTRVKEQVYRPDWTAPERVAYTTRLFELLCEILPEGMEGSVSTVPGSFKSFNITDEDRAAIYANLLECARHIEALAVKTGRDLHLGLEPEPLCLFENSEETVAFFQGMLAAYPEERGLILRRLGVNYDACHLAIEYETAKESLDRFAENGIRISKIHLSSALKVADFSESTLASLESFCEGVYLHQVIGRDSEGALVRYEDLDQALAARSRGDDRSLEWRIHFHIPLHHSPAEPLRSTSDHIEDVLDYLKEQPNTCRHFEMETYTWEVLPEAIGTVDVVDQLVREYEWTLDAFETRGLRG